MAEKLTDPLQAELTRLRQFVTDQGQTCWPCEKCGHATSGECLWCEVRKFRERLADANQQLIYIWETTHLCPCGARAESTKTHPHVAGCPTSAALQAAKGGK